MPPTVPVGMLQPKRFRMLRNATSVKLLRLIMTQLCNMKFAAKDKEKEVTKKMNKCRTQFTNCKGYEDSTVKYIASCKTGATALKSSLKSLFQAADTISKVQNKSSSVATKGNSSTSSRQQTTIVTITYTTITINTSDTSSFTNATNYMNAIAMFTDLSQKTDVDSIGSDATIRYLDLKMMKMIVLKCLC